MGSPLLRHAAGLIVDSEDDHQWGILGRSNWPVTAYRNRFWPNSTDRNSCGLRLSGSTKISMTVSNAKDSFFAIAPDPLGTAALRSALLPRQRLIDPVPRMPELGGRGPIGNGPFSCQSRGSPVVSTWPAFDQHAQIIDWAPCLCAAGRGYRTTRERPPSVDDSTARCRLLACLSLGPAYFSAARRLA